MQESNNLHSYYYKTTNKTADFVDKGEIGEREEVM